MPADHVGVFVAFHVRAHANLLRGNSVLALFARTAAALGKLQHEVGYICKSNGRGARVETNVPHGTARHTFLLSLSLLTSIV